MLKNKEYQWFIMNTQKNRLLSGWSYKSDALEALEDVPEHERRDCKVYTRKYIQAHYKPIMTKQAAIKALGGTPFYKIRRDMGKYNPGVQHNFLIPKKDDRPIWYEYRRDSHGPYVILYTIHI